MRTYALIGLRRSSVRPKRSRQRARKRGKERKQKDGLGNREEEKTHLGLHTCIHPPTHPNRGSLGGVGGDPTRGHCSKGGSALGPPREKENGRGRRQGEAQPKKPRERRVLSRPPLYITPPPPPPPQGGPAVYIRGVTTSAGGRSRRRLSSSAWVQKGSCRPKIATAGEKGGGRRGGRGRHVTATAQCPPSHTSPACL